MRNAAGWTATKYVHRNGRLRASGTPADLAVGSRLVAGLVAERYQHHLGAFASGRLLDLGCGKVPMYAAYRPLVREVVTVDRPGAGGPDSHVDVEHDLNMPLPFPDDAFDTVILSDVLEHLRRPGGLCGEIARVMRRGGHLIGNTPFVYPVHEAPEDYFRYTGFGLRFLFESAGLQVLHLEPVGGSLEVACDLLAKHLAQCGSPGRLGAGWLQALMLWFGRTRGGQAAMRATASRYTLGYCFVAAKA